MNDNEIRDADRESLRAWSEKIFGLLGLAAKKGSIVSGGNSCERALKNKRGGLLIIAGDSSDNTRQRFVRLSGAGYAPESKAVKHIIFGESRELGKRIGKGVRSVLIVTDPGLSRGILKLHEMRPVINTGVRKFGQNQSI